MEPQTMTPDAEANDAPQDDGQDQEENLQGKKVRLTAGTTHGEGDEKTKVEGETYIYPGDNLTEAVEMYDESTVYDDYIRSVSRRGSNALRTAINKHLENGLSPDEAVAAAEKEMEDWRPDSDRRPTRKSPEENILANFSSLPPEKQAEILARLQNQASGAAE